MIQSKCIRFLIIFFTFIFGILGGAGFAQEIAADDLKMLTEDLAEISERLDKVETKSILDRVTIGGEFRTRLDYIKYEDTIASGQESDAEVPEIWSNRLRLNLKAEITEDLVFHGRLAYFKLWGTTNYDAGLTDLDVTKSGIPDAEGDIHVERAYVDYFVPGTPLSFTLGRIPANDGPPSELKDNTTRKGTWPNLMVTGEIDGAFANLSLDEWTGLKNSTVRAVYVKIFQNYNKDKGIDVHDTRVYVGAFETEVPGVKDSLFWLSYGQIKDLAFSLPPVEPKDLGAFEIIHSHLQFNNIMDTGLDWFCTLGYFITHASSEVMLAGMGIFGDTQSGNLGDDRDGHAIYTGLRYTLPLEKLKFPKLGLEYNHGSKYWVGLFTTGGRDTVNKLGVNGDAYELYYIQPISEKHMFLRTGLVYMDYNYYNQFLMLGSQPESDMKLTNVYLLMDVRF